MSKIAYYVTILGIVLGIFTACTTNQPVVVACFSIPTDTVYVGNVVNFTNCSFPKDGFLWEFGDNTSSNLAEPSHSFTTAGAYSVILHAYLENSDQQDRVVGKIVVKPIVVATP
jgi:PKD repeat protein